MAFLYELFRRVSFKFSIRRKYYVPHYTARLV